MVVVLGGVGKLVGTVCGALGIGMFNTLFETYTSASIGKVLVFVCIVAFLQWKPRGAGCHANPQSRLTRRRGYMMSALLKSGSLKTRIIWAVVLILMCLAPLISTEFRLSLLAKFLALAILAIGLDLIWGYGGVLSLGHGVFFGLGGYAMAMYLKLQASGTSCLISWGGAACRVFRGSGEPFRSFPVALILGIAFRLYWHLCWGGLRFVTGLPGVFYDFDASPCA